MKKGKIVTLKERIQNIYGRWFIYEPLMLMVLTSHDLTVNNSIKSMRSGQGRIEYNESYLDSLGDARLEAALKAEAIRILLRHPYRYPPGNAAVSYMASNITLNEYHEGLGIPFVASDYWPDPGFRRQYFEFYYSELLKLFAAASPKVRQNQDSSQGSGSTSNPNIALQGEGMANASESSEPDSKEKEKQKQSQQPDKGKQKQQKNEGKDKGNEKDKGEGNKGNEPETSETAESDSRQGGNAESEPEPEPELESEPENEGGVSGFSQGLAENAALWQEDPFMDSQLDYLIENCRSTDWGSIKGELSEQINATLQPVVDYRKILSGFRATLLASEKMLTRMKPSRRYGFLAMGRKFQFRTLLLVGVDVSGSISNSDLKVFYSVINRFFRYGIKRVDVVAFDTDLQGEPIVLEKARRKISITGRGGTAFEPILEYFAENRKTYDGLIVFTDGFAQVPKIDSRNSRRTVWVCNSKANFEEHRKWMQERGRCCYIKA